MVRIIAVLACVFIRFEWYSAVVNTRIMGEPGLSERRYVTGMLLSEDKRNNLDFMRLGHNYNINNLMFDEMCAFVINTK